MIRTALMAGIFAGAFSFVAAAPASFDIGGISAKLAFAKHGADDPAGHDANDDRGRRGRGADDPAGHH